MNSKESIPLPQQASDRLVCLVDAALKVGALRSDLESKLLWQTVGGLQERITSPYTKPSEKKFAREVLEEMIKLAAEAA